MARDSGYSTEYYHKNREKLREADNKRYAIRVQNHKENRRLIEEELHMLLVSKGTKLRTGFIKQCLYCGNDFYCKPYRPDTQCCNNECAIKFIKKSSERFCVVCGNIFYCSLSKLKYRKRKSCSKKCLSVLIQQRAEERRLKNPASVKSIDRCLRYSANMDRWRIQVFSRDNYTCQDCGARSKKGHPVNLEAHHIKQFALFPELRFDVSNGKTLCKPCHKKVPHIIKEYSLMIL